MPAATASGRVSYEWAGRRDVHAVNQGLECIRNMPWVQGACPEEAAAAVRLRCRLSPDGLWLNRYKLA
jgi:hypothetical protein